MNYMGVDIGSSGCKAVVADECGRQLALAYREYSPIFTGDGGAELDSREVMDKCLTVIRETASQVSRDSVKALCVSSQGEAFTPLDENGLPLHNAMISSDTRSARYIEAWTRDFGADRLYQITGHTAHPMFSLFKLIWLKEARPEVWSNARRLLCFEDLLQMRLGLDPAMAWSLAGRTMMFDVREHRWSQGILDAVGLTAERLARPLPPGSPAGHVAAAMASELGLRRDTIVVTGGHDQTVGALGAGVTGPGIAMYATGTVECITPAFDSPVFSTELRQNNLCTYDHAVPGMYATVAFSLTGGNILKWFRDQFGAAEMKEAEQSGVNAYELLLRDVDCKPSGLLVLPYFTPSGTPYFDSRVKGAILGLRLSTTRGEFIRALLEGVALEMRLNLDILERAGCPVRELRAIGGGAKSRLWNQLKADVLGKAITPLDIAEAGCMGAAILACSADTKVPPQRLASCWVRSASPLEPDPAAAQLYTERFATYKQLYPVLRDISV